MKSILLVTTFLSAIAGSALAADVAVREPVPEAAIAPAFTWTGGYVGLHTGYAWGDVDFTDVDTWNRSGQEFGRTSSGMIGGAQAGYNRQSGALVYGVEADLGYLGLDERFVQPDPRNDTFAGIESNFYAALSARLGFAADRTLFYAKGGLAYLNADLRVLDECSTGACGGGLLSARGDDFTGWTIGGGVEHAFSNRWTAKIEYTYFDFGTATAVGPNAFGTPFRYDADLRTHAGKLGLNYRF